MSAQTAITPGMQVRRARGKRAVGTVLRVWTARSWTGAPIVPERQLARVAWPSTILGGSGVSHSTVQVRALVPVEVQP